MDRMQKQFELGATEVNTKYEVVKPIKFGTEGKEFGEDVKRRVAAYFSDNNIGTKAKTVVKVPTIKGHLNSKIVEVAASRELSCSF